MLTFITTIEIGPINRKPTTQRMGFDFNSFFELNGECYCCSDDATNKGLYKLGGNTDDGADIDAYFETPAINFDIDDEKKLREHYTFGELEDNLTVVATPDEHTANLQTQTITTPDATGVHRIKTKMGEGVRGTFWKFKYSNVDGGYFSIYSTSLLPINCNQGYDNF